MLLPETLELSCLWKDFGRVQLSKGNAAFWRLRRPHVGNVGETGSEKGDNKGNKMLLLYSQQLGGKGKS